MVGILAGWPLFAPDVMERTKTHLVWREAPRALMARERHITVLNCQGPVSLRQEWKLLVSSCTFVTEIQVADTGEQADGMTR